MSTLGSIYRSFAGLFSFTAGLDSLSGNVANMNTAGYKGQTVNFAEIDNQQGTAVGVDLGNEQINFSQGDLKATGKSSNVAMSGEGFFVLKSPSGLIYTRAGDFEFGDDGYLISSATGYRVQQLIGSGRVADIKLNKFAVSPAQATTEVAFSGNLAPGASPGDVFPPISGSQSISIKLFDTSGQSELANVSFTKLYYNPTSKRLSYSSSSASYITIPGSDDTVFWKVSITPPTGATSNLLSSEPVSLDNIIAFRADGQPSTVYNSLDLNYHFANSAGQSLSAKLKFGRSEQATVVSDSNNPSSNIFVSKNNGRALGNLVFAKTKIDQDGVITTMYSNGDSKVIGKIALATFRDPGTLKRVGNSLFVVDPGSPGPIFGQANHGVFGTMESGKIESSNVDLSTSFAEIVILQRGYQASSQMLTTTNKMLEELYNSTKG